MREALDQWDFVIGAYVLGVGSTLALVAWSWLSMKAAEARRDEVRGRKDADA